jgi:very-short-patch-repair endonuclease
MAPPKPEKPARSALDRVLREQEQIITRTQATECGLSRPEIRHRIRPGGPWQKLFPGVYLAVTGTPTQRQLEIAALRRAGPGSVLTGIAALRHQGVRVPGSPLCTVLVPAGHHRQSRGYIRVWPTTRMPEFVFTDGAIRFTEAARAVADAARELGSFREVRAVAADAVQRRRCRIDQLADELRHAPVRQSAWLRRALAEVADGVRSAAEADLRDLIRAHGLPPPLFNARLYVGSQFVAVPDAWWPALGVVVEVESREWHLSPEDWDRTLRRSTRMNALGINVMHFTPQRIRTEAAAVAAEIRSALEDGRPRPAVRTLTATG